MELLSGEVTIMALLQSVASKASPAAARDFLLVKIFSPSRIFFDGKAVSLSAQNATGPFDILPKHANFLCLLTPGEIRIDTGSQVFPFPISRGLLRVTANTATVFLDI